MTFEEMLTQVLELLQRQECVSYRALKRRFALDDDYVEDLKAELIGAQRVAADEDGKVLVWTGRARTMSGADARHQRAPLSHTPLHLVEMILYSREALEGERQRVTVLGDGIMTLLGAPLAHEDHAMRACCAAISMQDAVPSAPGAAGV